MSGLTRRLFTCLGIVGPVVLVLLAVWKLHGADNASEATHRQESAPAVPVKVMKPLPGRERTTTQPATVQAFEFVELFALVTGVLEKQKVDIDSRVKKGDLLAEIVAPDIVAERAQAYAGWKQAIAQKVQSERQVDAVHADLEAKKKLITQREAEKRAAEAYLEFRTLEYKRYTALAKGNAIDIRIVDEEADKYQSALSKKDAAVAAVETSQFDVIAKEAQLAKARADVESADANIGVTRAQLDKADVFVQFTKVIAPFDGVITLRNYNNGAFIRTAERGGQLPLLMLKRNDKFRIIVHLPDSDVPFVSIGDPAELVIATVRPEPFRGTVARTASSENLKSRTMRVEVDLENNEGILRDGMYGDITIQLRRAPRPAFMLPSTIVQEDLETKERFVFVVRDKKAHRVVVQAGPNDGKLIAIMSGLNTNDLVVTQNTALLSEGSEVEPEITGISRGRPIP